MTYFNAPDEAAKYGGYFGRLLDSGGHVIEPKLLWFLAQANLGPRGVQPVAIASFPKGQVLAGNDFRIELDDGPRFNASLVDDHDLPPTGVRKLSFVVSPQ